MIALGKRRVPRAVLALAAFACVWSSLQLADAQAREFTIPTFVAPGVSQDQSPSTSGRRPSLRTAQQLRGQPEHDPGTDLQRRPHRPGGERQGRRPSKCPRASSPTLPPSPRCTQEAFHGFNCPVATQIGTATIRLTAGQANDPYPVFNMVPPLACRRSSPSKSSPATSTSTSTSGAAPTTASRRPCAASARRSGFSTSKVTIWGVPGDPAHDARRMAATGTRPPGPYPEPPPYLPLLSNPTSCGAAAGHDDGRDHLAAPGRDHRRGPL